MFQVEHSSVTSEAGQVLVNLHPPLQSAIQEG
jgi:hypothetical protein